MISTITHGGVDISLRVVYSWSSVREVQQQQEHWWREQQDQTGRQLW